MSDSMTPPPCPTCGRRASRRTGYVRTTDKMACADPFHDAGDWGPALLVMLRELFDAADAFLATPPDDMKDFIPFGQPTIAKDCRVLNASYAKTLALLAAAEGRKEDRDGR